FDGGIRLGIGGFELARPAVEPEQDDGLVIAFGDAFGAEPQQIGLAEPQGAQKSGFEGSPPGYPGTVARPRPGCELKHHVAAFLDVPDPIWIYIGLRSPFSVRPPPRTSNIL